MDKYMIGYCGVWYWLLWSVYDGLLIRSVAPGPSSIGPLLHHYLLHLRICFSWTCVSLAYFPGDGACASGKIFDLAISFSWTSHILTYFAGGLVSPGMWEGDLFRRGLQHIIQYY